MEEYKPSLDLIIDVLDTVKLYNSDLENIFLSIIGRYLISEYLEGVIQDNESQSFNYIDFKSRLYNAIDSNIYTISNDNFIGVINSVIENKGKFYLLDRINCIFWILKNLLLTSVQKYFIDYSYPILKKEYFINRATENPKSVLEYLLDLFRVGSR